MMRCITLGARITPAYAGKTPVRKAKYLADWDHPRVCGENVGMDDDMSRSAGITPAYAGKTIGRRFATDFRTDHPRVCGENF